MRFLSFLLNALIFFLAFKYAILFSLRQGTLKNDVPDMYSLVYFFHLFLSMKALDAI